MAATEFPMHSPEALRDYALIADGNRAALIGPRGDIAWMSFPTWHSPAAFAGLIGSGGGFTVSPADTCVWGGSYEHGTLIWRSRWTTRGAAIESRDALALPSRGDRAVILRRLRSIGGAARMSVRVSPATDYGRSASGRWTGRRHRRRWTSNDDRQTWHLTGATDARIRNGVLELDIDLEEGDVHDIVLEIASAGATGDGSLDARTLWAHTERAWQDATADLTPGDDRRGASGVDAGGLRVPLPVRRG